MAHHSIPRGGTYKYFIRGQHETAAADDYKVEHIRKQQLRPYDAFLKKFQYHDALNAALEVGLVDFGEFSCVHSSSGADPLLRDTHASRVALHTR